MTQIIEPLGARPLPSFSMRAVTTFNANDVESPFVIHWLEWQAERLASGSYLKAKDWNRISGLLQSALSLTEIWGADEATKNRLLRKIEHAAGKAAGR